MRSYLLKGIFCLIFSNFHVLLNGQDYFNAIIPFEIGNPNPTDLLIHNDQVIIHILHNANGLGTSTLMSCEMGEIKCSNSTYEGYLMARESPHEYMNNFFAFANNNINDEMVTFIRVDSEFDQIKTLDFNTPSGDNGTTTSTFINTHLYGASMDDTNINNSLHREVSLFKFDTTGILIWQNNYNQLEELSFAWEIAPSLDNQLLVSMGVHHYDQFGRFSQLTKLDTGGNIIWQNVGAEAFAHGAVPTWIAPLSDGTIVQTYFLDIRFDPAYVDYRDNYPFPPVLKWYSAEGDSIGRQVIWTDFLDITSITDLEVGRGDYFFGYGRYEIQVSGTSHQDITGWLFKMSNTGEMIWSKRYRHPDFMTDIGQHVINDIVEMDNGDILILILGRVNNIADRSHIWLMRVNEFGCFGEMECDDEVIITSIDDPQESLGSAIQFYPNPTSGEVTIQSTDVISIDRVAVYDITGLYNLFITIKGSV